MKNKKELKIWEHALYACVNWDKVFGIDSMSYNTVHDCVASIMALQDKNIRDGIVKNIKYKLEKATGKSEYHDGWRDGLQAGIDYINTFKN